jgi:alpha-ketoglutarate-dependent taurine dioxygenase
MASEVLTAGRTRMTVLGVPHPDALGRLGAEIDELLARDGAVLVRGLGLSTPEEFETAVRRSGDPVTSYRGGNTPRQSLSAGVFTSTEYPPRYEITLHNELSYAHRWPARLYFSCLVAAESGGATPICDGRGLLADLEPRVRERFAARGVAYHQFLHGGYGFGKSWQDTFETSDRGAVEEFLREARAEVGWAADDQLRVVLRRPGVRTHPVSGEEVWFNQADQWHPSNLPPEEAEVLLSVIRDEEDLPHRATYGDGSPISPEDLASVRAAAGRHRLAVPWRAGDLMIIDNMLVLHGREPYTGPRRVVVSMT